MDRLPLGERNDDDGRVCGNGTRYRVAEVARYATALIAIGIRMDAGVRAEPSRVRWFLASWRLSRFYSHGLAGGKHDLFQPRTGDRHRLSHRRDPTRARAFVEAHPRDPFFLRWRTTRALAIPAPRRHAAGPNAARGTRADSWRCSTRRPGGWRILNALDRLRSRAPRWSSSPATTACEWCRATRRCSTASPRCGRAAFACPLLRWPAQLPARAVSRQVCITMDLTASILAAAV